MDDYDQDLENNMMTPYEDIEKDEEDEKPYEIDYSLSSYGIDFDVTGLVRRLKNSSVYLPDFQRNYVWNIRKASKFIESMLLGLPIPGIFLYKEENNQTMLIIDGYQRLETLKKYYSGLFGKKKFELVDVVDELDGLGYLDLPEAMQRKLDDTLLHATIIKADDPEVKNFDAIYLIFERLNTGGINLSPQEIRNCVSHGILQKKLICISSDEIVKEVIKIDQKRKKDQEIILRLIALTYNHSTYSGNMKQYLNDFMFEHKDLQNRDVEAIADNFISVATLIKNSNLDSIFRPNGQLSIAILDSIWVGISRNYGKLKDLPSLAIINKINRLLKDDNFEKAIRTGKTHHTESVKNRLDSSIRILGE